MEDGLRDAIEDLAGEVRSLSDRIYDLEGAVRNGGSGSAPPPATDSSLSAKLDRLSSEVKAIRREMF